MTPVLCRWLSSPVSRTIKRSLNSVGICTAPLVVVRCFQPLPRRCRLCKKSSTLGSKSYSFLKDFIYLFLERWGGRKRRDTSMCCCLWSTPYWGPWPTTQECALTGIQNSDPLVLRLALNPLSHTSQVILYALLAPWNINFSRLLLRASTETIENVAKFLKITNKEAFLSTIWPGGHMTWAIRCSCTGVSALEPVKQRQVCSGLDLPGTWWSGVSSSVLGQRQCVAEDESRGGSNSHLDRIFHAWPSSFSACFYLSCDSVSSPPSLNKSSCHLGWPVWVCVACSRQPWLREFAEALWKVTRETGDVAAFFFF